jgi:hypothetical protein
MLNRSKIAIVVDSFVRGSDIPGGATGKLVAPLSRFDDRVNYQQPNVNPGHAAPHCFQTETLLMPSVRHERTDAPRLR